MTFLVKKSFLYNLLDINSTDEDEFIQKVTEFYTLNNIIPEVTVNGNDVEIDFKKLNPPSNEDKHKFEKAVKYCNQQKWDKAVDILNQLKEKNPQISEYHRLLAQIKFENKNLDKAKDDLIEALKWDNQNTYALILMGNVYYYGDKDVNTALEFWNLALRSDPHDCISLTNIGSLLCQEGNYKEGMNFLDTALSIDENYPNARLSYALAYYKMGNYTEAFEKAIASNKACKNTDLVDRSISLSFEIAEELVKENKDEIENTINSFISELKKETDKPIEVIEDSLSKTPAKLIIAEYQNKPTHQVVYREQNKYLPHLMLHELHHLKLVNEARKADENKLFTSSPRNKAKFFDEHDKYIKSKEKAGLDKESITGLLNTLFDGLNSQFYNTPIDLFIEDKIFKHFPVMRSLQMLSVYKLLQEGIEGTTSKAIVELVPKSIVSKSKILNLVLALHYDDLFGIDLIDKFKPNHTEKFRAKECFDEFNEYRNDREPGEEYEIIQHWADDLKSSHYFDLIYEKEEKNQGVDDFLKQISDDPFGVNIQDKSQLRQMKKFVESNKGKDLNMAVVMYKTSALSYFKDMAKEDIKKISFDFATLGMTGIDPNKNNYEVSSMDKKMTGYQALSYYYVAWALAIPEHLGDLQLPFDNEYKIATSYK